MAIRLSKAFGSPGYPGEKAGGVRSRGRAPTMFNHELLVGAK